MAIVPTVLDHGGSGTDSQNYSTASVTRHANKLITLAVASFNPFSTPGGAASSTGFDLVGSPGTTVYGPTSTKGCVTMLRQMLGADSTGAVSFTIAGSGNGRACWALIEWDGIDTTGTNGSGAIVQSVVNNTDGGGTPFTLTCTLAALGDATNNAVYIFGGNDDSSSALSATSGYTELTNDPSTENLVAESNWKLPGTTTPGVIATVSFTDIGAVAIEIKAAGGGATAPFLPLWWGDLNGLGRRFFYDRL